MAGNSIFELGDKFGGVSSPFGDWLGEQRKARELAQQKQLAQLLMARQQAPEETYKRLVFFGGAAAQNEIELFGRAADNVIRDYTDVQPEKIQIPGGGQSIVDRINTYAADSLQSIDFLCHGNDVSLLFKVDADGNYQELYYSDQEEQKEGVTTLWNMANVDKNKNGADITEIDYSKFTVNAKIEIHGCNASSVTADNGGVNLSSELSRLLHSAGKNRAVVIGHVTYANPNNHSTLSGDDYRHGVRRIYHGGSVLFLTKDEGRIGAALINKYLSKKETQGTNYNGENEKTY
jgi:hypothetical protein